MEPTHFMSNINFLQNKKIAILGLGVNNEKLVDFLIKNNIPITICDRDENKKIKLPHYSSNKLVSWKLGEKYLDNLNNFNIVFRSPGIPYLDPKIQKLKKQGIEISSQTKLFFELCPAMIIGVTGTKGKGTTSTLIYEMLQKSNKQVFLAGNIGEDPFNYLEKLKKTDIIVLELSSFQLQDLNKSPHIAVVLNITVDHLDYHRDRNEYIEAKKTITKFQNKNDYIVTNADYQDSKDFSKISKSKNLYFSVKKKVRSGCYYKNGWLWLAGVKAPLTRVRQLADGGLKICSRKDIKLLGTHNLENVSAAVSAAAIAGASIKGMRKAIKTFSGLEHRLEYAGKIKSVKYYNDSFSTTPQTVIAAINSFDQPIILIAGGSDKGADFTLLAREIIERKVKAVILIGDMAQNILNALLKFQNEKIKINIIQNRKVKNFIKNNPPAGGKNLKYSLLVIIGRKTMKQIVNTAYQISEKNDIVLLSPACASFGMFKNYKERGEMFKREVANLKPRN
jgi:UDP-N-acetylmuramoylalanine--D-glutamate ligase